MMYNMTTFIKNVFPKKKKKKNVFQNQMAYFNNTKTAITFAPT